MKKIILVTTVLFLHFALGFAQNPVSEADQLLEKTAIDNNIIGISAGYAINGEMKWKSSYGYANQKDKIPFSDSTLTRTASIAKSMTAIAIMQLVEQGLIDLDKPIQTYLPDFPKKTKSDITVRHLLAHISGIDGYQSAKEAENNNEYANLSEAMHVFWDRDLRFEPGTDFYYTTYGYVVLGVILEKVSGLSFETYMQKNIWNRAGMKNTGVEHFSTNYNNKSSLYHAKKSKAKEAANNNLSNRIPGGGFYSTLNDMIKFGNAVLDGSLITKTSLDLMIENQFPGKEGNPYGFGWFLYGPKPYENAVIGHSGEQTGSATQIMIHTRSNTVVVVLANTSGTWKEVIMLCSKLIGVSEKGDEEKFGGK